MDARAPRTQQGFTMTEIVVVIAILGILAAVAGPSMTKLMQTQRVRSTSYDLFADLTFARSEAIARGHNVQIASAAGSTNWLSGWTVTDTTASPAVQLRAQSAATGVTFTADQSAITFDRSGRASINAAFSIVPLDTGATSDMKRCVKIDPSGRPRTLKGVCT